MYWFLVYLKCSRGTVEKKSYIRAEGLSVCKRRGGEIIKMVSVEKGEAGWGKVGLYT